MYWVSWIDWTELEFKRMEPNKCLEDHHIRVVVCCDIEPAWSFPKHWYCAMATCFTVKAWNVKNLRDQSLHSAVHLSYWILPGSALLCVCTVSKRAPPLGGSTTMQGKFDLIHYDHCPLLHYRIPHPWRIILLLSVDCYQRLPLLPVAINSLRCTGVQDQASWVTWKGVDRWKRLAATLPLYSW